MLNSVLKIIDNSGLLLVKTIHILSTSSFKKKYTIGDVLVCARKTKKRGAKNLKKLNKILVLSSRLNYRRKNGVSIKYDKTTGMVLTSKLKNIEKLNKKNRVNIKLSLVGLKELKYRGFKSVMYFMKSTL